MTSPPMGGPVPPGVVIQTPPSISFVQAFPTDQAYQGEDFSSLAFRYNKVTRFQVTSVCGHKISNLKHKIFIAVEPAPINETCFQDVEKE